LAEAEAKNDVEMEESQDVPREEANDLPKESVEKNTLDQNKKSVEVNESSDNFGLEQVEAPPREKELAEAQNDVEMKESPGLPIEDASDQPKESSERNSFDSQERPTEMNECSDNVGLEQVEMPPTDKVSAEAQNNVVMKESPDLPSEEANDQPKESSQDVQIEESQNGCSSRSEEDGQRGATQEGSRDVVDTKSTDIEISNDTTSQSPANGSAHTSAEERVDKVEVDDGDCPREGDASNNGVSSSDQGEPSKPETVSAETGSDGGLESPSAQIAGPSALRTGTAADFAREFARGYDEGASTAAKNKKRKQTGRHRSGDRAKAKKKVPAAAANNETDSDDDDDAGSTSSPSSGSSSSSSSSRISSDRRRSRDSDNDNNQGQDSDDSSSDDDDSEEEEELAPPEVLSKSPAKNKYFFLRDYLDRATFGCQGKGGGPWFANRRIGSLELTKRLEIGYKLEGHDGCVNALHFDPEGSLLASGSDDKDIIVWDWERRRKKHRFDSRHEANVFQSKFLPLSGTSPHIVSTSRDGQVRLAILRQDGGDVITKKMAQHRGSSNKLALLGPHTNPYTFVTCGDDGVLWTVDVREPKATKLLVQRESTSESGSGGRTIAAYTVHANPADDNMVVTAGRDPHVRMYDRRYASEQNNQPVKKYCPRHLVSGDSGKANITCAVWNHNGTEIVASYNDEEIYLFDVQSDDGADAIKKYQGHRNSATVKGVNFYGPKSEFIVSGSDCGNVFLWDKESESIVNMIRGDVAGVVNVLEPHPHLPILATSGLDHEVKIFFPTSNEEVNPSDIEKTVMKNAKERRDNANGAGGDWFEGGEMLMFMLQQLRRNQRRRTAAAARGDGGGAGGVDDSDTDSADDDDDEYEDLLAGRGGGGDGAGGRPDRCLSS